MGRRPKSRSAEREIPLRKRNAGWEAKQSGGLFCRGRPSSGVSRWTRNARPWLHKVIAVATHEYTASVSSYMMIDFFKYKTSLLKQYRQTGSGCYIEVWFKPILSAVMDALRAPIGKPLTVVSPRKNSPLDCFYSPSCVSLALGISLPAGSDLGRRPKTLPAFRERLDLKLLYFCY